MAQRVFLLILSCAHAFVLHKPPATAPRRAPAATMLWPWEGKTGVDVRPYDKLLNKAAPVVVPLLVGYGSKVLKPLYSVADKLRNRKDDTAERQATSNAYKPCVVFSSRTVKNEAAYKKAFSEYAEAAMAGSGVRACFSFMDRDKDLTALQFAWYDSAADFAPQSGALADCYSGSEATDYTQIWGAWDEGFKAAMTTGGGCKCSFVEEVRGFLKEPTEANAKGFATGEPPMIWISRRDILPGRMEAAGSSFQCGTDRMYTAAPAALGICEFTDPDDENASWSLRVFNDYNTGFKAHFPVPSPILFRMVFNVIPEWVPGPFPLGFSFSSQEYITEAVKSNGGNAAYVPYTFESDALIGPKPDFGKGF